MAVVRRLAGILLVVLSLSGALYAAKDTEYAALDRLYVKAKDPLPIVPSRDPLILLMYHSYPTPLRNLRITSRTEGVAVTTSDPALKQMLPTIIVEIPVTVQAKDVSGDTIEIDLAVTVDEVKKPAILHYTLPTSAKAAAAVETRNALPVGQIEVKIEPHGNISYGVYVAGTLLLIALVVWRYRRTERERG
jgi:hypothetical protein